MYAYRFTLVIYAGCMIQLFALALLPGCDISPLPLLFAVVGSLLFAQYRIFHERIKGLVGIFRMPKWLIFLASITFLIFLFQLPKVVHALDWGKTPAGSEVTSIHWMQVGNKFFLQVNHGDLVEITKDDYESRNRSIALVFSPFILLFSFLNILLWRFLSINNGKLNAREKSL